MYMTFQWEFSWHSGTKAACLLSSTVTLQEYLSFTSVLITKIISNTRQRPPCQCTVQLRESHDREDTSQIQSLPFSEHGYEPVCYHLGECPQDKVHKIFVNFNLSYWSYSPLHTVNSSSKENDFQTIWATSHSKCTLRFLSLPYLVVNSLHVMAQRQGGDQHRGSLAAAPSSRRWQEWRQIFPSTEGI